VTRVRRTTRLRRLALLGAATAGLVVPQAIGGSSANAAATAWPTPTESVPVTQTIPVSGSYDGRMKRFYGKSGDQSESQAPLFEVANGGTLSNVVIGAPGQDGIHCLGTCTLRNVWWEDVGEDAATFKGTSASQTMTIDGGGAKKASDKVFQHNGPGTMIIKNFEVSDFGKLYRACGDCSKQYQRHVRLENITVTAPADAVVGINSNYGDTARFTRITVLNDPSRKLPICERWKGVVKGQGSSTKLGSGADGTHCIYSSSDITYR
jgi:hypothetical protein